MSNAEQVSFDQTLHVRDHCLCLASQRAARALARRFDDAFREYGITSGQFSLLNALNRPPPPSLGAVAALLVMDRTTLTANLKPLHRDGLIAIGRDREDRRVQRIGLTAAGRDMLAKAMPVWIEEHRRIDAGMADGAGLRSGLALLA